MDFHGSIFILEEVFSHKLDEMDFLRFFQEALQPEASLLCIELK